MLKRSAIVVHRWLGVVLCLFFLLWFPSGIGMMYWDFPSVDANDRLARSPALDPAAIHLSPAEALAVLGGADVPSEIRLNTFDARPVYRFRSGNRERLVYADSGTRQAEVTADLAARVAERWVGQPAAAATVQTVDEADQWTVQRSFSTARPLRKYSWPDGQQVYVSLASGEVVQYTTRGARIGAYLGPIPHWLYFTPLRRHQRLWTAVVVWSSAIATLTAIAGLVVGVWIYSPSKRYRVAGQPTAIPYRGQKRWHTVLGLLSGIGAATWAFSGMLSMDPVPAMTRQPRADVPRALRDPLTLSAFAARDPGDALRQLRGVSVKEMELVSVAGEPAYIATLNGGVTRIVPIGAPPREQFDDRAIARVVDAASRPDQLKEARLLDRYDAYYLDRHKRRPLPVILAELNDKDETRYYIDPKTARVVGSYSRSGWVSRWLYHALHSLDLPWLYDRRPLWDIIVITLMVVGTALAVTSLVLAWRVLGAYFFGATAGVQRARLSAGPLSR